MKKTLALVLTLVLLLSVAPGLAEDAFTYPMEPVTLTINLSDDTTVLTEEEQKYYFWNLLDEKTGVTLERVGGAFPYSTVTEEFQLMLASQEYPDLIWANWYAFPGGPAAALEDGYIISLNDYAEYMPNYMAALEADPELNKLLRTDDGDLYCFSRTNTTLNPEIFAGPMVRQDWLDKLNLEAPTTIQEWHDVLVAFRDELKVPSPFSMEARWLFLGVGAVGNSISSPWKTVYGFYVDDGVVKHGVLDGGYKDFVATMAQWYKEGLIDKDFASVDKKTVTAKFSNGETGITIMQKSEASNSLKANAGNPEYKISALYTPVLKEGDPRGFGQVSIPGSAGGVSISTQCKDIEAACRFLDYFWGKEGGTFATFGTEGYSYEYVDGEPTYTEWITNHPTYNFNQARITYCNYQFPHLYHEKDTADPNPIFQEMVEIWTDTDIRDHLYPAISPTVEESEKITDKLVTIDTYCKEMIVKFIIGMEPMEKYDAFVDQVKALGLEDVLAVYQAMYDRYQAR